MGYRSHDLIGWGHLNRDGRCAVRRWYRLERRNGATAIQARAVVQMMCHAMAMAGSWTGK